MRNISTLSEMIRHSSLSPSLRKLAVPVKTCGSAVHRVRQTTGKVLLLSPWPMQRSGYCVQSTGFSRLLRTILPLAFPRLQAPEYIYYPAVLPTFHRTYNNNNN